MRETTHPCRVAMCSVEDLEKKIKEQADQISILTSQNMSLEKENRALRGFMGVYQEDLDSERAFSDRMKEERDKLSEKVSILIRKIARLQAENLRKQHEISDLREGFEY